MPNANQLIDEFVKDYSRHLPEYDVIRRKAHESIDSLMVANRLMAIVTSRSKDPERLREKLLQRNEEKHYTCAQDIFDDIPDLIGLRIALYFPSDADRIQPILEKDFRITKVKKFPMEQRPYENYDRRFPGYCATHYRVYLKAQAEAPILEIQVASLLMHAWSEVEHDLAYKKMQGPLTYDEYEALDQLNGIVLSGELALQRLYRLSAQRKNAEQGRIESYYELAAFLYKEARKQKLGSDIYLGDMDALFRLFRKEDRLTYRKVENDLKKVDWHSEVPIARQLADLYASSSSANTLMLVQDTRRKNAGIYRDLREPDISKFIRSWISLQKSLVQAAELVTGQELPPHSPLPPTVLREILPGDLSRDFSRIRNLRNALVHGADPVDCLPMDQAMEKLEALNAFVASFISSHT